MRKTFDFTGHVRNEPVEFILNGVVIHCAKNVSGMTMLQFATVAGNEEVQDGAAVATAIMDLLKKIVLPSSWPAFVAVASDPESGVGVEELGEIVGWLAEAYSDRPTQPSSQSSIGPVETGPGSTDIYSPAEQTVITSI